MNQEKWASGWIDDVVGVIIVRGHGSVRRTVRAQHTCTSSWISFVREVSFVREGSAFRDSRRCANLYESHLLPA
jgi:hypothetical protein